MISLVQMLVLRFVILEVRCVVTIAWSWNREMHEAKASLVRWRGVL
jgi:hypothetical protein